MENDVQPFLSLNGMIWVDNGIASFVNSNNKLIIPGILYLCYDIMTMMLPVYNVKCLTFHKSNGVIPFLNLHSSS